ncbi:GTP cyclohydrolase I FolE [Streptomyces chartreusis]|uniref:GTP cyclohydrolase I FolE n=1 Tax=Streptomyces chartreusis TaxID=1969 RepID=UPI0038206E36
MSMENDGAVTSIPRQVDSTASLDDSPDRIEHLIRELISLIGEDPERAGLQKTPQRVRKSLEFLTEGYNQNPLDVIGDAIFEVEAKNLVVVRDIEFYSQCEHHMLPFFGQAHIGYLPLGRVVGLSKLPRLVDLFAHRLQIQERLTEQIADVVEEVLAPAGVAVVVKSSHLCMMMRGVEKQCSSTYTSAFRGQLEKDPIHRSEFLNFISSPVHSI